MGQENSVCLEQQIYAIQENVTQPLVVMVETFRMSAQACQAFYYYVSINFYDKRLPSVLLLYLTKLP